MASNGSLALYSGSTCADPNPILVQGAADGICTQILNSFWSLKINQLDAGCSVTVYDKNNEYCGLGRRFEIYNDQCIGNDTSLTQFSVDCPANPLNPTPSSVPASSARDLTPTTQIAVGVSVPVAVLALTAIGVWLISKRKARNRGVKDSERDPPVYAEMEDKPKYTEVDAAKVCHEMSIGERERACELDSGWLGSEMQSTVAASTSEDDKH